MPHKTRVVTSTACPVSVSRPVVTVACPTPTAVTLPATTQVPTVTTDALQALAAQLGLAPTAAQVSPLDQLAQLAQVSPLTQAPLSSPAQVFANPLTQLGGVSPFAALAANNPVAALASLSPALNIFNPAINPAAAFLQFNPAAAPSLALSGKGAFGKPFGKPFGKGFGKGFGKPFGI